MANLVRIFGPLVTDGYEYLDGIDIVAFDVMGTLLDDGGYPKADVLRLFYHVADQRDVKTVFISTDPDDSFCALVEAGCKHRLLGDRVQPKKDFYAKMIAAGKKVLAVDDTPSQSSLAVLCIDPNDEAVAEFLRNKKYPAAAPA